jgi:quercetin dioxygenase-like cupin family protein
MRMIRSIALLVLLVSATASAHEGMAASPAPGPHPDVAQLMTKALGDYPGKEIVVITVDYPPGIVEPAHHHDAHAIVYVLQGNIVMGVKGQPEQHLKVGDTFYEGPDDIHTVGRNASATEPAKFLVFILKDKKNPIVMPVH